MRIVVSSFHHLTSPSQIRKSAPSDLQNDLIGQAPEGTRRGPGGTREDRRPWETVGDR